VYKNVLTVDLKSETVMLRLPVLQQGRLFQTCSPAHAKLRCTSRVLARGKAGRFWSPDLSECGGWWSMRSSWRQLGRYLVLRTLRVAKATLNSMRAATGNHQS